jgi:protein arginine N-methyltransferase 7
MLHDQTRNAAYASGIRSALANRPGARVLEVGTGSGLFSVLAANFGASHVTGYEMLLPVAAAAARAFATNGLYPDRVMLAPIRSSAAPTPPREALADIVVHEVFDPMLLGEGVAPSLRDAAQRLAAPGAIFVPSRATVFVHAFCSDNIAALRWPPLGPLPPLEPKDPSSLSSPSRASCSTPSSPSRPAFNARAVSGPPQFYLGIVEAFAAAAFGPRHTHPPPKRIPCAHQHSQCEGSRCSDS